MIAALEIVAAVLALAVVASLGVLIARRQWLLSREGIFSCEVRQRLPRNGSRWVPGVARYSGNSLLWYKMLSASFRPTLVIRRRGPPHGPSGAEPPGRSAGSEQPPDRPP